MIFGNKGLSIVDISDPSALKKISFLNCGITIYSGSIIDVPN